MPNIRIKDIPTTASATSSTDFIGIDGSANGTRKLSAYSPTFGGNLTVSGTGTSTFGGSVRLPNASTLIMLTSVGASGSAVSVGADDVLRIGQSNANLTSTAIFGGTGNVSINAGASLAATFSPTTTTLAGNLTVSGTGTSSFAGPIASGAVAITSTSATEAFKVVTNASANAALLIAGNGTINGVVAATAGAGILVNIGKDSGSGKSLHALGAISTNGNLTVSGTGNSSIGGTLLVNGASPSGNGAIQLATHTTSAGGIGFGTDTALYRYGAGRLGLSHVGGSAPVLYLLEGTTETARLWTSSGPCYLDTITAQPIYFRPNGTTALTLDTSLNATFASNILLAGAKGIGLGGQTNPAVQGILASGNNTNINANSSGAVNIGTASNGTLVTIDSNGVIKSQGGTAITPASASASGTAGMIQWDASYIYVCTAANTWKRVAIATW